MYTFDEKQYGRIYTDKEENIQKIKETIRKMDEDEYDYLPDDLISVFNGKFDTIYNGKFYGIDLDELASRCKEQHITCGIIKARMSHETECFVLTISPESYDKCIQNFYETGVFTRDDVLLHYNLGYLM